jgi:hypothetical protein
MGLILKHKNKNIFSICNNHDDSLWKIRILMRRRMEKETKGEKMVERKRKLLGNAQGLTHFGYKPHSNKEYLKSI